MAGTSDSSNQANAPTADRVIDAAARLFRAKGYAATTTREIAEELNLQKASLYHHMQSKEDLLYRICSEAALRMDDEVSTAIAAAKPTERLQAFIEAHLTGAIEDRDMHAVTLVELRSLSPERQQKVVARRDEYRSMVVELLREEQAAGRIRSDISARLLALALLDLLNWVIFWYRPGGELSPIELARVLGDIYLNGAAMGAASMALPGPTEADAA